MTGRQTVPLGSVAYINPNLGTVGFDADELVDFVPMAAVEADASITASLEARPYEEVKKGYTYFADGDILLAKITPCFENGKISQIRIRSAAGFGSTEFHVIRPQSDKLDARYLVHLLRQEKIRTEGERRMTGSAGQRRVPKSFLESLPVFLPPLAEQRRIAAILDKADALRTKRREALAQLDRLAQSIFVEMFGDPLTNSKAWKTQRLDSICEVGSSKRVFVEELTEKGIPFFRGTEIGQLGEGIKAKPTLFISIEHYLRLKTEAGVPRKGDLLLPSICPDGRIFVVDTDEPFYFKDARVLWIKVPQHQMSSLFLKHYLKLVFANDYSKIASGTTFAELKIFALKQLEIAFPPTEMQYRFDSLIRSLEAQTEKSKQSQKELSDLFSSLQFRAFRGEL